MTSIDKNEMALAHTGIQIIEEGTGKVEISVNEKTRSRVELPKAAIRVLIDALKLISEGHNVAVRSMDDDLSTQKAADLLYVSRPYLIKILENGEIPFRKVGKHRRILLSDLEAYKGRIDADRLKVLGRLAAEAQKLELGY